MGRRLFTPVLLIIALAVPGSTLLSRSSPGKYLFERAYRQERDAPRKAIQLYRSAVRRGLDRELRQAARWRMFYLYKSTGEFMNALRMAERLGRHKKMKFVIAQLKRDMRLTWKVSKPALVHYMRGMRALYGFRVLKEKRRSSGESFMTHFNRALAAAPGNRIFRMEIINRLIERGRGDEASNLARDSGLSLNTRLLLRADGLVANKEYREAVKILRHLSNRGVGLRGDEKARILYLLGRIERARGRIPEAVRYFRLAARYGNAKTAHRHIALAAYALYKRKLPVQAMSLLRGLPASENRNIRLLELILRVRVDGDRDSSRRLRAMKPRLLDRERSGRATYLERRALALMKRRRL